MVALSTDELVDAARSRTGLDDFGADTFREGLEVLVRSASAEAGLSPFGHDVFAGQLVGTLVNRLEVEAWYRRHPEIDDQDIVAPLFGLGLPRTGSTALSFLLAQDPAVRSLRTWEAAKPCPPPESGTEHDDPRIAETEVRLAFQDQLAPEFKSMLPTSATGPSECLELLALDFRSMMFEGFVKVPTYAEWLYACDMEPAYRYHRRVLKLLQWHCPPTRWRLKTPSHMFAMGALDRVYPDARFVMTHRDPTSVIPSVASLMTTLSGVYTEHPDPSYLGAHCADAWEEALHRLIAFRDAQPVDRFFDIGFRSFQSEPVECARALYGWLGEELSPAAEERMRAWWAENPRDKHGAHTYRPEDYGIDVAGLRARYRFYNQRFDVPSDER